MIPAAVWTWQIAWPQLDPGTESFTFRSSLPDGTFIFVFTFADGRWNGWVTLPSGKVRAMGCTPDVVDWTGFLDYGVVLSSPLPSLGLADLVGSSLIVMRWGP